MGGDFFDLVVVSQNTLLPRYKTDMHSRGRGKCSRVAVKHFIFANNAIMNPVHYT